MKRRFLLHLSLPLLLSSCTVHIGDAYCDVPWWIIAVPTALILLVALYFTAKAAADKDYVCGECGKTFSPTRTDPGIFLHNNDKCVLQCPHCGKRGFCKPSNKKR